MTLAIERKRIGRKPLTIVEVDLDFCQESMGQSSCTAVPHGNALQYSEQFDSWPISNTTVTPDTDSYSGALVADTINDASATAWGYVQGYAIGCDVTKNYTAWIRVKKDAIGRATRFPLLRMIFTAEYHDVAFDTATGEFKDDLYPNTSGVVITDPEDSGYWLVGISSRSVDPVNSSCYIQIFPAVGASATWAYSAAVIGSIVVFGGQVVEGYDVMQIPIYAKTTTAAVAATTKGAICYNTRKTCKAPANYRTSITNLLLWSEAFDNAVWNKTNATVNANVVAYDGLMTGDELVPSALGGYLYQHTTITPSSKLTFCLFVKGSATLPNYQIQISLISGFARQYFDMETGTLGAKAGTLAVDAAAMDYDGDGWYKISMTVTADASDADAWCYIISPGGALSNIYLHGAQLAASPTVGAYAKTEAVTVSVHNPKTYRFCENIAGLPVGLGALPCVKGMSTAPTRITPGKGLGYRASVTVEMTDFTHHDRGVDPYVSMRSYDPATQGSFFGKLLARNPYYKGRVLRVMSGYLAEDGSYNAANFDTRTYIIESFEIANSNGKIVIKAKDVLSKTDADKAQAPATSTGTLSVACLAAGTSITLHAGEGADYDATGSVRIGDEIIDYTSNVGDVLSGLTRATWGSVADDHDVDDSVQQCLVYTGTNVVDVVSDLLLNYTNIPVSMIPSADWNVEKIGNLSQFNVNAIITKPEGVKKLLGELAEQSLFNIWWDERAQQVKLKSIAPYITDTPLSDAANFKSISVSDKPNERVSRMIVYYGLRDRVNPDKEESYKSVHIQADLESELATKHDEKKIKVVKSRWYDVSSPVIQFASRTLKWMAETPKHAKIKLDAKDGSLWISDPIDIESDTIQGIDGAPAKTEMMILEAFENKDGDFEYLAMTSPFFGRYAIIMANGTPNYAGENSGGYIADNAAGFASDGGEAFKIT